MTSKEQKKLEAKWEKILQKHGLGIAQPMTDNSEGDLAEIPEFKIKHPGQGKSEGLVKLRQKLDGEDSFMGGHQITKVRGMYEREVPAWTLSNNEVQTVLLRAFPKLLTSPKHKKSAGRWARVIYLYYRMKLPEQVVAREIKLSVKSFKSLLRNINRIARGLTSQGLPRRRHPSNTPVKETSPREAERKDERITGSPLQIAGNGSARAGGTTS